MVECNFIAFTVCIFANVKETGILARKTVYLQVIQLPKNIGERVSKSFDRVDIIVIIMENIKFELTELNNQELVSIDGGMMAIKWSWTSFWRGVGIGAASGGLGAASYYA